MRLLLTAALAVAAVFGLLTLGAGESRAAEGKTLIVYFSWGGNTRQIAQQIQKRVGGDFFEVEREKAYPTEYRATTQEARKELDSNARPALKRDKVPNLADYDVVFIGTPNWWGTLPTPVMTFLEANDLSGKTVAQFITHEGSGVGRSSSDLKRLAPKASFTEVLAIRGGRVSGAQGEVDGWLKSIGLAK